MGKKRLILFASLLALAAVFTYSSARLISNLSAKASFLSYHTTTHSAQEKKLKSKRPLKSVVKIKIRYVGAEYNYALQSTNTIKLIPAITEDAIFTPQVSFVYKYCNYATQLRGPPMA